MCCKLSRVEVMGRDISVVAENKASLNPAIRAIIGTENNVNMQQGMVRFALVPRKVLLFDKETEERIKF